MLYGEPYPYTVLGMSWDHPHTQTAGEKARIARRLRHKAKGKRGGRKWQRVKMFSRLR